MGEMPPGNQPPDFPALWKRAMDPRSPMPMWRALEIATEAIDGASAEAAAEIVATWVSSVREAEREGVLSGDVALYLVCELCELHGDYHPGAPLAAAFEAFSALDDEGLDIDAEQAAEMEVILCAAVQRRLLLEQLGEQSLAEADEAELRARRDAGLAEIAAIDALRAAEERRGWIPPGRKPGGGLRHLAFFEVLAELEEDHADRPAVEAALMSVRALDHERLVGHSLLGPDEVTARTLRACMDKVPADDSMRPALLAYVNALHRSDEDQHASALRCLWDVAEGFRARGYPALAGDVYFGLSREASNPALASRARLALAEIEQELG